jgi:hypothetical protein
MSSASPDPTRGRRIVTACLGLAVACGAFGVLAYLAACRATALSVESDALHAEFELRELARERERGAEIPDDELAQSKRPARWHPGSYFTPNRVPSNTERTADHSESHREGRPR